MDRDRLVRTVVDGVVVHRAFHGLAVPQFADMVDQHISLKGIGMVIVDFLPFLKGQLVPALVIIVIVDHGDLVPEGFLQPVGECGFSGACPACDPDENGFSHETVSFSFFLSQPYQFMASKSTPGREHISPAAAFFCSGRTVLPFFIRRSASPVPAKKFFAGMQHFLPRVQSIEVQEVNDT